MLVGKLLYSTWIAGAIGFEQVFRLFLELFEVGFLRQTSCRHGELLPSDTSCPHSRARKSFAYVGYYVDRVGSGLFRGLEAPRKTEVNLQWQRTSDKWQFEIRWIGGAQSALITELEHGDVERLLPDKDLHQLRRPSDCQFSTVNWQFSIENLVLAAGRDDGLAVGFDEGAVVDIRRLQHRLLGFGEFGDPIRL